MRQGLPVVEHIEEADGLNVEVIHIFLHLISIATIPLKHPTRLKLVLVDDGCGVLAVYLHHDYHIGVTVDVDVSKLQVLLDEPVGRVKSHVFCILPIKTEVVALIYAKITVLIQRVYPQNDAY